jgi:hypothetical protein
VSVLNGGEQARHFGLQRGIAIGLLANEYGPLFGRQIQGGVKKSANPEVPVGRRGIGRLHKPIAPFPRAKNADAIAQRRQLASDLVQFTSAGMLVL